MANKITIANFKGGVGKSLTSIMLATNYLSEQKKKNLVIDLDPQGSVTKTYRAETQGFGTMVDALINGEPLANCVQEKPLGNIVASEPILAEAEHRIPTDANRFYKLIDASESVEEKYDYIFADTPPGDGCLLGNALCWANGVIIPVTADSFGIQGVDRFYETVSLYKKRINPNLKVLGILINRYKGRERLTKDIVENLLPKLAEQLETKVFEAKIRDCVKVREAQALGVNLFDYAPYCSAALDYKEFFDELREREREVLNV